MKKRSVAALIAALAVVAVGIVVSFFLSFSSNQQENAVITLPGQGPADIETNPDIEQGNRDKVEALSVDRSNIQKLVAELSRPEAYSCTVQTTYYYSENGTTFSADLCRQGELLRISQNDETGKPAQQSLLTEHWTYVWNDGMTTYQRFPRQQDDADLYSRSPTYERLLELPAEQILVGELREMNDHLCLYAESFDPDFGERAAWYILVENGLLLYCEGTAEGSPTYRMDLLTLEQSVPETADFLLPDGSQPE